MKDAGIPCTEIAKKYGIKVGTVYYSLQDYEELLAREHQNQELFDECVASSPDMVDARRKFSVIMNRLEKRNLDWHHMTEEACRRTRGIGPLYTEIILKARKNWVYHFLEGEYGVK